MEKFSVAISVYKNDNPEYFKKAMQSITDEQTLKPNEIVLVKDGVVKDGIENVIKEFTDKYDFIKVIAKPVNEGLGLALKTATENCSYPYIARMDSDDISLPDRFIKQMTFLSEHPEVDFLGGDITEFSGDVNNVVSVRRVPRSDSDIKKFMKRRSGMNHVTVVMKKSKLIEVGGYQKHFNNEDYYLWARAIAGGAYFSNLSDALVNVRVGDMFKRRGGYAYYKSEKHIYKYMLSHRIINLGRYLLNCAERFIVHVLMPEKLRGFVYKKYARKKPAAQVDND